TTGFRGAPSGVLALATVLIGTVARAEGVEPSYGRVEGDVAVVVGAGASSADPRRMIAFGLELRPLFLYRWLGGHETHRARWDLLLDSFGLEFGMTWPASPHGDGFAAHPGIETGVGLELPILPDATGLWLA